MSVCPNCGYCDHCKRARTLPWYPVLPWAYPAYPHPYPYYPTWISTTGGNYDTTGANTFQITTGTNLSAGAGTSNITY